jgi:hypothetical protein
VIGAGCAAYEAGLDDGLDECFCQILKIHRHPGPAAKGEEVLRELGRPKLAERGPRARQGDVDDEQKAEEPEGIGCETAAHPSQARAPDAAASTKSKTPTTMVVRIPSGIVDGFGGG